MDLLAAYVPSATGDPRFAEIAQDYTGGGTTCGFLTSWLIWRLGCRDARILNRSDPAYELRYADGQNLSRLVGGAKLLGAWRTEGTPQPGDLLYFARRVPESRTDAQGRVYDDYHEHVAVSVDCSGSTWRTADAGRRDARGQQCAEFVARAFGGRDVAFADGPRRLYGFVDLDALPYEAPPQIAHREKQAADILDWLGPVVKLAVLWWWR